jgi:hypothetical protein
MAALLHIKTWSAEYHYAVAGPGEAAAVDVNANQQFNVAADVAEDGVMRVIGWLRSTQPEASSIYPPGCEVFRCACGKRNIK